MKITMNLLNELVITIDQETLKKLGLFEIVKQESKIELPKMHKRTEDFLKKIKVVYGKNPIKRNDIKLRKIANEHMIIDISSLLIRLNDAKCIKLNCKKGNERNRVESFEILY